MSAARRLLFAASGLLLSARALCAQAASQTVMIEVGAVNQIAVTGAPSLPAYSPTPVASDGTWGVTTNQAGTKIAVSIRGTIPAGVTFSAELGAPDGANSAGLKPLGSTPVDLVTGISCVTASGLSLVYRLDAKDTTSAVIRPQGIVTFTVLGGA